MVVIIFDARPKLVLRKPASQFFSEGLARMRLDLSHGRLKCET